MGQIPRGTGMTDLEKRSFLEREGYPMYARLAKCVVDVTCRIISRRKAAGERRRLRKAGFEHRILGDGQGNEHRDWYRMGKDETKPHGWFAGTRQEAIAYLDRIGAINGNG